ncbi:MAG: FAD-dependent monooxygenase [Pseudomonadota bacterium]
MSLCDVIVVGGGMVGATLTSLLARSGFSAILVDARGAPGWSPDAARGLRVSALSPSSEAVLKQAGAWAQIEQGRHGTYRRMRVEDGQGSGAIDFEAARFGFHHLGTIVENDQVAQALWDALPDGGVIDCHAPARLESVIQERDHVRCMLDDGTALRARLLVGCDGAGSGVRRAVGIDTDAWEYNQKGLVTQVRKAQPNMDVAWQRFLLGGPLAFLPLGDGTSSIVWSLPSREADSLCALDEGAFSERLEVASKGWLGEVLAVGPRATFPLAMSLGRQYVAGRVVLLGDAAHAIHPLAGQGVNLGLADAAGLVEKLAGAGRSAFDAPQTLTQFERWRRSESSLMAQGIHALGALFRPGMLAPLRGAGMAVIGRSWTLREAFLRRAAGLGPNAPRLAHGATVHDLSL